MEPIQFIQLLKKHSTRDIFREILIISKNPSNLIESITNILMQCYIDLADKYGCEISELGRFISNDLDQINETFKSDSRTGVRPSHDILRASNMLKNNLIEILTSIRDTNLILTNELS